MQNEDILVMWGHLKQTHTQTINRKWDPLTLRDDPQGISHTWSHREEVKTTEYNVAVIYTANQQRHREQNSRETGETIFTGL